MGNTPLHLLADQGGLWAHVVVSVERCTMHPPPGGDVGRAAQPLPSPSPSPTASPSPDVALPLNTHANSCKAPPQAAATGWVGVEEVRTAIHL